MDILSRGTALNDHVRIFCCRTTDLVQKARDNHDLWPTAAAALGRTLSVGCIMGCMLKDNHEKIEIQINGQGDLGTIIVDAYCKGKVRGYVEHPHVTYSKSYDEKKLDVGRAVGTNGVIRVIKDLSMKQPFVSEVAISTGEIGDDFAYYYYESEQTPSVVSVGVLVNPDYSIRAAGGLIIQLMPNASEEDIAIVETVVKTLKPISTLIDEGKEPKEIVQSIFADYNEMETYPLRFKCECSKGRYAMILARLPEEDLLPMIKEDHGCEVVCKFCNAKYHYGEETLQGYINAKHGAQEALKGKLL